MKNGKKDKKKKDKKKDEESPVAVKAVPVKAAKPDAVWKANRPESLNDVTFFWVKYKNVEGGTVKCPARLLFGFGRISVYTIRGDGFDVDVHTGCVRHDGKQDKSFRFGPAIPEPPG